MNIAPFATEHFFARYEFTTPFLLCASDVETMTVDEVLRLGGLNPQTLLETRLGYGDSQGNPDFRAAVAGLYDHAGPDEVIVLNAPEEGIYLTMRALLEPGDHVVALTPAYDSLTNLADHITGNVSRWPLRPGENSWELDLPALSQLVTDETRLIVVNFPHNPTGVLPTRSELDQIIAIARSRGVWLFCDEMYRGLERQAADRLPSVSDLYDRSIVLAGLSKTHGLPGLRVGWLVVKDGQVRDTITNWKFYTTICPPAPSEVLALAALRAHKALLQRSRAIITANLSLAEDFFPRHTDLFDWRTPRAGSVALVGLNVPSAEAYCRDLARDAEVLLLPGSALGAGDGSVRFGFGRTSFPSALARLDEYLTGRR